MLALNAEINRKMFTLLVFINSSVLLYMCVSPSSSTTNACTLAVPCLAVSCRASCRRARPHTPAQRRSRDRTMAAQRRESTSSGGGGGEDRRRGVMRLEGSRAGGCLSVRLPSPIPLPSGLSLSLSNQQQGGSRAVRTLDGRLVDGWSRAA
jgi:hypothetical protein